MDASAFSHAIEDDRGFILIAIVLISVVNFAIGLTVGLLL